MNYYEFVRIVEKEINNTLEGGMQAKLYTAIKNNSQKRIGIVVERPDINISPTIYLEDFFEKYHHGAVIEEIVGDILTFYETIKCEKSWNTELFEKYENIKSKIVFRVINTEKNRGLLEKVPHIDFLDLSIVFYALLDANQEGTATMLVYYDNLEQWGISQQELLANAIENVKYLLPPELTAMGQIVAEMVDSYARERENLLETRRIQGNEIMYILSNGIRSFGAACILYPGMLKLLGELLGTDYYVLPSSIHEVIIVTKTCGMSFQEMCDMVQEVNREQVSAEEILSDHAYYYSRKYEKLFMKEC